MSKTIVISGGSRGIGAATARLAGKRGWSVAFSYVGNPETAETTRRAVEANGGRALAIKSDAAAESDVVALFDAAIEAFGPIDGVVNNAGIILPPPIKVMDMGVDRLRRIVDVNVIG